MKNIREEVREQFLKCVAEHKMTIKHESGVYRHIEFRKASGSFTYCFQLITYPGHLVIGGDCGCFVFCRVEDMFNFFRGKPGELCVNPGYWAEKVEAQNKTSGVKQWSEELFRASVGEQFNSHDFADEEEKRETWEKIKEALIEPSFDNGYEAHRAVYDFDDDYGIFLDFWDCNCDEYTHGYLWCLYAIVWGIEQYDKAKEEA